MKGRKLILIASIIVLSFAGVGYSAWSEGLNIKSFFATGNIHVIFKDPVIVNDGLNEVNAEGSEDVLDINGTVAPGSTVQVEYDIFNDSTIPVKYDPDGVTLPEGITLDLNDTVLEPGEYLRGNQLTIEPGENELILPFVQYNSSGSGWKQDLKISWNITVAEETVVPELDMMNEKVTTEGAIEDIPQAAEPIEAVPGTEPPEIQSPVTDTIPGVDPTPVTDPINPDPANGPAINPTEETPVVETPSEDPAMSENSNEGTGGSETLTETDDENSAENNTESDKGSEENAADGEE